MKKRILCMLLAAVCFISPLFGEPLVHASDAENTADLLQHADELNEDIEAVDQDILETEEKIADKQEEVEKNALDLAAAKLCEQDRYDAMSERIQFMYEGGDTSLLEILLNSTDMADFLNNAEYISTITDYDRQMLQELMDAREAVEEKQEALETQEAELETLQASLNEKRDDLTDELTETQEQIATDETIALMAGILECEAGVSYEGMIAVGTVILNRVRSSQYPNSIREVVYQSGQFSPVASGKLDRVLQRGPMESAYKAAKAVLSGEQSSKVKNCLYFNATFTGKKGIVVGDNVFW